MDVLFTEQAGRQEVVRQAVANLQARGITPRPAVLALYEQYAQGELSRTQVTAFMQQQAVALFRTIRSAHVKACRVTELVVSVA